MDYVNVTLQRFEHLRSVAAAITALVIVASSLLHFWQQLCDRYNDRSKTAGAIPQARMGIFETVRMISNQQLPWLFLQMSQDLGSQIFKLNLPLPGHPKTVVVAELEDYREILRDELSDKSYAVYGQLVEISPTRDAPILALSAHDGEWHRRRKGVTPAFSSKHVRRMNDVAQKYAQAWIQERLTRMVENNESFDVVQEMTSIIIKAFAETALEYQISDEEQDMFVSEWDIICEEFILKSASNPFRKYLTAFLPERRRAKRACENVFRLFHRMITFFMQMQKNS